MCGGGGGYTPPPVVQTPVEEVKPVPRLASKNDLNTDDATQRKKKTGTNSLKIDLLPSVSGSGLSIPQ